MGKKVCGNVLADIDNGANRAGDAIALPFLHFIAGKIAIVQRQNGRYLRATTKMARHGHVQLGRHEVGKIVNAQSRLVRINPLGVICAIARPKRPENEVAAVRHRELCEAVNAAMLALPVSDADMVIVMGAVKACFLCLLCRKKSSLAFCDGKKPGLRLLGRAFHDKKHSIMLAFQSTQISQLLWYLCRRS
ncbi:MAG: hypothetical protein BGO12_09920 [Verrucomicrobia bacterium 61-8]|nr:MAG: hypothetical protein BGO12_09920 [Verrucomicrobia bacterium 61-8]